MTEETVVLGQRYRDPVSEFEGVAIAFHNYLYGCRRVTVAGRDSDGKPDEYTFDEPQLEPSKAGPPLTVAPALAKTGGPRGTKQGQP